MKKLLLPLCVGLLAVNANADIGSSGSHASSPVMWNAQVEDKLTGDAFYWKSKGAVELAKSKALDLEAKNIAKTRNIGELRTPPLVKSNKTETISDAVGGFFGNVGLNADVSGGDSPSQEQSLENSPHKTSAPDRTTLLMQRQQRDFLKQVTTWVNDKLAEHDKKQKTIVEPDMSMEHPSKQAGGVNRGSSTIAEQQNTKPVPQEADSKEFKYSEGMAGVESVVLASRIVDIRNGYTRVMFSSFTLPNDDDTPSFMTADVYPTTKTVDVRGIGSKFFTVKVTSFTPTSITFKYKEQVFSASIH